MVNFVNVYKALSDMTRIRILHLLLQAKNELCICEIMDSLQLAQYNISKHIKELKIVGLVKERKEGRFVFYSTVEQSNTFYGYVIKSVESFKEKIIFEDNKRLEKRLSLRKNGKCIVGLVKKCRIYK